jgi:transcription factor SFP1
MNSWSSKSIHTELSLTVSYEEEHANLAPDLRMAALNAAQNGNPLNAQGSRSEASQQFATMSGDSHIAPPQIAAGGLHLHQNHGDAPTPPGMQDIEMEEPHRPSLPPAFLQMPQPTSIRTTGFQSTTPQSPWATAFRPQGTETPPHGVPPSLLSFAPPNSGLGSRPLTPEQVEAKASKKAQRKAEKAAAKDEASASDAEGEKRFLCPISGCGKVYKQANGLKYHLTRSINSGHGKVAALGGLTSLLGEKGSDTEI